MKLPRIILDRIGKHFDKGNRFERLYPLYEAIDSFFYTTDETTKGRVHVRDANDFKRTMMIVVIAVMPCALMAMYNTGFQANTAMADLGMESAGGWRGAVIDYLGVGYDAGNILADFVHGALYFLPIYIVCMIVGGTWEVLFACVRGHEVNEGFFVTGILFPLTLPASIPLWQVAVGITFGVVVGKEIFGGTGRNFLNPALTARAFLFFAYPNQIVGSEVWVPVDGFSGATPLAAVAQSGMSAVHSSVTWLQSFMGTVQGSMGETSALACLLGVGLLLICGLAAWRVMASMFIGAMLLATLLYLIGSETNHTFEMPPHWHLVVGGFAFGLVFMITDPVSSAMTPLGQWIYGFLVGGMIIMVRVINPAFPEGTMLAILFGNTMAPLIDHYVVRANIKRRACNA
ncbi:MAG: NADH:ubiquinone reductase (Na(+)-transporting) subunit B [Planctomycetota bacterium]|nr:NADH:ubiquinone reductase (Na(+)-transporting) subunit B [Planctomycetota bacterium]